MISTLLALVATFVAVRVQRLSDAFRDAKACEGFGWEPGPLWFDEFLVAALVVLGVLNLAAALLGHRVGSRYVTALWIVTGMLATATALLPERYLTCWQ